MDLLCFCCKAPALLNTHSKVWVNCVIKPRRAGSAQLSGGSFAQLHENAPGSVETRRTVGGSSEGNLKEAVPRHLYLV